MTSTTLVGYQASNVYIVRTCFDSTISSLGRFRQNVQCGSFPTTNFYRKNKPGVLPEFFFKHRQTSTQQHQNQQKHEISRSACQQHGNQQINLALKFEHYIYKFFATQCILQKCRELGIFTNFYKVL